MNEERNITNEASVLSARQALNFSEVRYRRLFETAKDGILILDAETGVIVDANPFLIDILGSSYDILVGKKVWELGFFKDIFANQAKFAELQRKGYVRYDNLPLETEDGRRMEVEFVSNVYLEGDAKVIQCNIRDITESKKVARRQLLLSEILGILNNTLALPDMISGVLSAIKKETGFDAVGIRLKSGDDFPYFSQSGFSNDFLLTENSLLERDMDGGVCMDKDYNPCLQCTCGLVISGKTDPANLLFTTGGSFWTNNSFSLLDIPSYNDSRFHPRNKCVHEGYCSVALIPIHANKKIVGLLQLNNLRKNSLTIDMINFFERVSASIGMALMQKQAEKELRESEEKYRLLFENAGDAIFIHDMEMRILAVNHLACDRLGYTYAELMSMKIAQVDAPEESQYAVDRIATLIKNGHFMFETVHQCKDSSLVPTEVSARQISWNGQPAMMSICRDITERRKAEEEKVRLELLFRESHKMEAVGQLAGGISHDFNNLLTVITGYSQMILLNPDLKVPVKLQIKEILHAGERAAGLTRQLLLFSRRQTVETRVIDLGVIISGMEKMLLRLIKENIIVTIDIDPDLWQIKADSGNIEQVIMNLILNAGDAMSDGGALTVATENIKIDETNRIAHHLDIKPGSYVMLSVKDTGCGMDDKIKEHIFEPFFTTKEVGKGTGLGLSTVYGIVKHSNAYIDVQSEIGKGTRFRIYFPKGVDERTEYERKQEEADLLGGPETILLVDDEDIIRGMLQNFLESIGYTVLAACSGQEALALAENHKGKVNLLLTDVVMPGMNGFELAMRVKNSFPEIKLFFMSGYNNPKDKYEMIEANENLIQKPICIYTLASRIRKILEK